VSAWCLLQVYEYAKKIPQLDKKAMVGLAVVAGVTIIIGYSQVLWQPDGETNLYHPELISILEELICFWN
jgi:negative regulator of sigma E activity